METHTVGDVYVLAHTLHGFKHPLPESTLALVNRQLGAVITWRQPKQLLTTQRHYTIYTLQSFAKMYRHDPDTHCQKTEENKTTCNKPKNLECQNHFVRSL